MKISGAIITWNEQAHIARAIESLRCCDEIVVVDSGSTDATRDIAARLGARVLCRDWRGFAAQKNFAAEAASHDWILSLDADEAVSETLEAEIWQLKRDGPRADAYSMPRLAQYLGRWIRHSGWYPDRKVRLYDRRKARWTGQWVHERLEVSGTVAPLAGHLLHFTCDSLSEHLARLDRYTTLAAEELAARGERVSWIRIAGAPLATFVRTYFLRAGFLDGPQGLVLAWMAGFYTFLKYAKAREEIRRQGRSP
ncbi:MAG: glycosyltransferase family 2 protein [Bryobacterales bacterium]|nr:glycosyltransferase family 2 protein [Bryobacteraceae bacterium]MDW8354312.1 glycosyltransferase family 2 protein [Bryobacterales bacterium]